MPMIFFLDIKFHDFSVKSYLILYAKQNKSGSERSVSVFNRVAKLAIFCIKQGRGLKASAAQLCPDFPSVPPGMSLPRESLSARELPFFLALLSPPHGFPDLGESGCIRTEMQTSDRFGVISSTAFASS